MKFLMDFEGPAEEANRSEQDEKDTGNDANHEDSDGGGVG